MMPTFGVDTALLLLLRKPGATDVRAMMERIGLHSCCRMALNTRLDGVMMTPGPDDKTQPASERLRALDFLGYRDRVGTVIAFVDALPELAAVVEAAERALQTERELRWRADGCSNGTLSGPACGECTGCVLRASLDALREKLG